MAFACRPRVIVLRRADDRPRRHDAGARARDGPRPVPQPPGRGAVRQPRPRGRRRARRPRRGDVRRADRRERAARADVQRAAPPVHAAAPARRPRHRGQAHRRRHPRARAPLPGSRPEGCFFHPRCEFAQDDCRKAFPPVTDLGAGAPGALLPHRPGRQGGAAGGRAARPTRTQIGAERRPRRAEPRRALRLAAHAVRHRPRGRTTTSASRSSASRAAARRRSPAASPACTRTTPARCASATTCCPRRPAPRSNQARREIQYVFQNPYASLNPRRTVGQAIARQLALFEAAGGERGAPQGVRVPRARRALVERGEPVPRPALGRRAPARRDRPRARGGPEAARVRRGHLGARRLGAGGDHRAPRQAARADGLEPALHHPRPRAHPHDRRPRDRDDRRAHRGAGHDRAHLHGADARTTRASCWRTPRASRSPWAT